MLLKMRKSENYAHNLIYRSVFFFFFIFCSALFFVQFDDIKTLMRHEQKKKKQIEAKRLCQRKDINYITP